MIIRTNKNVNWFVQVDKRPLEDARLSWKAKGLMAYLLSRVDNWTVVVAHLATVSNDGETAVRSALKELAEFGYAKLETIRGDDGKLEGKCWNIFEHPDMQKTPTSASTDIEVSRTSENPNFGKPDTTNNDSFNKKEASKKERLPKLTDEEFIKSLKENPAFSHVDVDSELGKAKAWCVPRRRQCTQRFFTAWLSRIEKPIGDIAPFKPLTKKIGQFIFSHDKPPTREQCGDDWEIYMADWENWKKTL